MSAWYENIPAGGVLCTTAVGQRRIVRYDSVTGRVADSLGVSRLVTEVIPCPKPFTVRVNLDVYFDIPAESLPAWANEAGVEQLVEKAIDDYNAPMTLQGLTELLQTQPSEVTVCSVLIA